MFRHDDELALHKKKNALNQLMVEVRVIFSPEDEYLLKKKVKMTP